MADEVTPAPEDNGALGGLGAMRLMMSGGAPMAGQDQIEQLGKGPYLDPSNKWLRAAAAAIAPTKGGSFAESLGNSINAYADSTDKEAELRAKYLPIVAQALLQRQQMQYTQANAMYKLTSEWDGALTGSLTGLLSTPNGVTPENVQRNIYSQVQLGKVPPQYAAQFIKGLPTDPATLRDYIMQKSISGMGADARVGAVSPKVEMVNSGGAQVPVNTNANAGPTPVGPMGAGIPATLTPKDRLPVGVETPKGPMVRDPVGGGADYVGSPGAQQLSAGIQGQGQPPAAPPGPGMIPGQVAPGGPGPAPIVQVGNAPVGAQSVSAQQDLGRNKAEAGYGDEFTKYRSGLDDKVDSLRDMNDRIGQMRQYMSKFRTGATADVRTKYAAIVKDGMMSMGFPAEQAEATAARVQGGDVAAAQAFQKLSVQGAMESLKGAMQTGTGASAGRVTQAEFQIFVKNNPNLDTDPRAIEKIHNFIAEQYRKALGEQDYVSNAYSTGTPLDKIRSGYAQQQGRGSAPPTRVMGNAMGTIGPAVSEPIGISKEGRNMKQDSKTGLWYYEDK